VTGTFRLRRDKGRALGSIADDLGLDETTVSRYAAAFTARGRAQEPPGSWGRLPRAQQVPRCRQGKATLYTDGRAIPAGRAPR
jgi:hypothetical protein